jgi:hypothetical protein
MSNYTTKYFGEISINETDEAFFSIIPLEYNGQKLQISFYGRNNFEYKLKILLDILDKYIEIDEIGRKAIIETFSYEKLKELNYPNLCLSIRNDEINISLEYETLTYKKFWKEFNKYYKEERSIGIYVDPIDVRPLRVNLDEKLNVLKVYDEHGMETVQ